jgi:hypothetical protein
LKAAFRTTQDAVRREGEGGDPRQLNLVGLAMRAERKVIDKIVDGLKFHGQAPRQDSSRSHESGSCAVTALLLSSAVQRIHAAS